MSHWFDVCCCRRTDKRQSSPKAAMERVEIFESGDKAFEFLGRIIEEKARLAITDRKVFVIGLSGK